MSYYCGTTIIFALFALLAYPTTMAAPQPNLEAPPMPEEKFFGPNAIIQPYWGLQLPMYNQYGLLESIDC